MTAPPLPASPCVRVRLIWSGVEVDSIGSRFFLSYSGSTPSVATLNTLASDIAGLWNTNLAAGTASIYSLTEIDILDIASDTGASGSWTGTHPGGGTGEANVSQTAVNCEYNIARRYRGGKPRIFHPPPDASGLQNASTWNSAFITGFNTNIAAFFSGIAALSIGSLGSLQHVNLSYYKGFVNVTNSSGRERAAPTYRSSALVDTVTGYSCKAVIGSQRRRRTSTTP